jgi:hypothetical protein
MTRKIKHKTPKFFGYAKDAWARLRGRYGKKRSYGHFASGNPGGRTRAEIENTCVRREEQEEA